MASSSTGTVGGFSAAMRDILREYGEKAYPAVTAATDRTAKEVAKLTRAASPVGKSKKHYKSGWTSRVTAGNSRAYTRTVYNSKKAQLTHLLQNGHGGPSPAGAKPHIVPDEETEQIFTRELKKELEE